MIDVYRTQEKRDYYGAEMRTFSMGYPVRLTHVEYFHFRRAWWSELEATREVKP